MTKFYIQLVFWQILMQETNNVNQEITFTSNWGKITYRKHVSWIVYLHGVWSFASSKGGFCWSAVHIGIFCHVPDPLKKSLVVCENPPGSGTVNIYFLQIQAFKTFIFLKNSHPLNHPVRCVQTLCWFVITFILCGIIPLSPNSGNFHI